MVDELLRDPERDLLHDLGVFSYGFTFDSVETLGAGRAWAGAEMEGLAALVDSSLVDQQDIDGVAVFSLLSTVREHAVGQLRARGEEDLMRSAHARLYADLALREAPRLGGPEQRSAVARLNLERSNLRSGVRHLIVMGDTATAAEVGWRLYLYWWIGGYLSELSVWMQACQSTTATSRPTPAPSPASTCCGSRCSAPRRRAIDGFCEVSELFAQAGEAMGSSMALAAAGLAQVTAGDDDLDLAAERMWRGAEGFRTAGARWGESSSSSRWDASSGVGSATPTRSRCSAEHSMPRSRAGTSSPRRSRRTTSPARCFARGMWARRAACTSRGCPSRSRCRTTRASPTRWRGCAASPHCGATSSGPACSREPRRRSASGRGSTTRPPSSSTPTISPRSRPPHAAALQAAIDRGREYGALEAAEYALAGVPDAEAAATISAWRAEART